MKTPVNPSKGYSCAMRIARIGVVFYVLCMVGTANAYNWKGSKPIPGEKYYLYTKNQNKFLNDNNVKATAVAWPDEEGSDKPNVMKMIADHKFDLIVNIPKNHSKRELTNGYRIRRGAIDHNIPLITNARLASAFIEAFCQLGMQDLQIKSWQEYDA